MHDVAKGAFSIVEEAKNVGLDPSLLYDTVIELANEGQLTAGCINRAAGVLLADLGLPEYFFGNISRDALKRVLRAIAMNMQLKDGVFVLRSEVAHVQFDVDEGVQARIATAQTRDRMEAVITPVMAGRRVEYYYGAEHGYYTYIIRPEQCKKLEELAPGESPFAFNQVSSLSSAVPKATSERYESFLKRALDEVMPLVEVSDAGNGRELRVMFREDFHGSSLPVIRQMLADLDIRLNRVYWETYRGPTGRVESVCSAYLLGKPPAAKLAKALAQLRALLALHECELEQMFITHALTFDEYVFATNAYTFIHSFIHKNVATDGDILRALDRKELRDAMAKRMFDSNRSEYTRSVIMDAMRQHPDLVKQVFSLFDRKFNPRHKSRPSPAAMARELEAFQRKLAIAFIDDKTTQDIFAFMTRMVTQLLKTNFYKEHKRSYAFRFAPGIVDPLVFTGKLHGVFYVVGFYAMASHMRADEVARGGLRLIRVTQGNYENELDNMPLLNFALGPVAQRLKHKDIAESGAKGVIVPGVEYARDGLNAIFDLTEGIMDLVLPSDDVVDYLGKPERIFFGPDEGTAGFMDAVAERARIRGDKYWRTITTGKSIGIPHDTYGLTRDRKVFGLISNGAKGTELVVDGASQVVTTDMEQIYRRIGDRIGTSGMTTMSVLSTFRALLAHVGLKEEDVNLAMTGGPDGDLGANQIQSFKGKICLIIDGGSVLFDPEGLDKKELMKIAFARHTEPRLNSLAYPEKKLSAQGFKVPRAARPCALPGGEKVDDGAFFHRNFLTNPEMRARIQKANMQAFIPCGGAKDTINAANVRAFLGLFAELKVIVEGANVFFDDTAREVIARDSKILQIKDSTANKGGVTSSSIAEVLTAFLLGDAYEKTLVNDPVAKSRLIREVFDLISGNAVAETKMLLSLHVKTGTPLYKLSSQTSEQQFALQAKLYERLDEIVKNRELVAGILEAYIPALLLERLGMPKVLRIFSAPELQTYRDAILTKKAAAMALYRHAADWEAFLTAMEKDFRGALLGLLERK